MMTKEEMIQDLFNKMWRGLAGQNWQRAYDDLIDTCSYRLSDGRKCAVGHCIPDNMYSEDMEGQMVDAISAVEELGWDKWPEVLDFLKDAQYEHDSPKDDLEARFKGIAEHYGLTIPDMEVAE